MFCTGSSNILHTPFIVADTNTTIKLVSLQTGTNDSVKQTEYCLLQFLRFEPGPKNSKIQHEATCQGNRSPCNRQMEFWMEGNTCIAISATIAPRHLLQEQTYGCEMTAFVLFYASILKHCFMVYILRTIIITKAHAPAYDIIIKSLH